MGWENIYLDNYSYFFSSSIVEHLPIFKYHYNIRVILELMDFYRDKYQTKIQAYVIMPSHLHLIVNSMKGENIKFFIQNLLRKSSISIVEYFTNLQNRRRCDQKAKDILRVFRLSADARSQHAVWKEKSKGIPIYSDRIMKIKLDYIHDNPVRAGLVKEPGDYLYSSFRNYYFNDHSIFKIDCVDVLSLSKR